MQDEIFSSAYATAAYLKYIIGFPEEKRVYVIGEKGIEDELDSVGIKHCGGTVSPTASTSSSFTDSVRTIRAQRTTYLST